MANKINGVTRGLIIDELLMIGAITGKMNVSDFVSRVYPDVKSMESTDYRFSTATDDIWQHMDNNNDWDFNYLFNSYLKLQEIDDDKFLFFLEQYVHPLIKHITYNDDFEPINLREECVAAINKYLVSDGFKLEVYDNKGDILLYKAVPLSKGVKGEVKNIIFATKYKPEIVFSDALNNDILITKNEDKCLIYNKEIPKDGVTWEMLINWFAEENTITEQKEKKLVIRLLDSLDSEPEKIMMKSYVLVAKEYGGKVPALIPQVFLYYDPLTVKQRGWKLFEHQKMDFLMIISMSNRVVIEIDGVQHYGECEHPGQGKTYASPKKYASMVSAQRDMSLYGYDVYRFGGFEFTDDNIEESLNSFFKRLFRKYGLIE